MAEKKLKQTVRFQLDASEKDLERIKLIQETQELTSMSAAMRKALDLYFFLHGELAAGATLVSVRKTEDGKTEEKGLILII